MVQQEFERDKLPEQDDVRILLVGDPGVGKTSLIYSLVNDEFDLNVPARMSNITIPAKVTPENVTLYIVDYSEKEQTYDDLKNAIISANVICIVYIAGDDDSLDNVVTHWVPIIRKCQAENKDIYKPIILVANKVDLIEDEKPLDKVTSVIQEFVEVEAFIEVSALTQKNVVELFSSAQKAIIYPLSPLFDPQMRILTRKCGSALVNIFQLCDLDGDGLLSDHELNLFQENCFGTPLQRDALDDLKSIIKQSTMDGIVDNSMTLTGFLFLHTLSIDKGRHDFTWQVLRKFNYDNQINTISENLKLVNYSVDDFSNTGSLTSSQNDNRSHFKSSSEVSDEENENFSHPDQSWVREHSKFIKTGLGLTVVTLVSMLAIKYLVQSSSKSSG